ncbi:MAG: Spy/CpxP family protein refolding chaperone [Sandaracinaceae bacterium]
MRSLFRPATFAVAIGTATIGAPAMLAAQDVDRGAEGSVDGRQGHGARHGHRGPLARARFLARELDLTETPRAQVRALVQGGHQQARALRSSMERGPELREAVRTVRASTMAQVRAVLSPEQQARLDELRAERRFAHHRRGRHIRRAFAQLDLSDEQKAEIRAVRERARADASSIRATETDPEARRAALRGLREQVRGEIRAVLTPEQAAELDEIRASHPRRGRRGPAAD